MRTIFWTGKLSPMMKFVANFSNVVAWVTGNARDTAAMKQRVLSVSLHEIQCGEGLSSVI
jgi:hypothetical protein